MRFGVKKCADKLHKPTEQDLLRLKQCLRLFQGLRDVWLFMEIREEPRSVDGYGDSDWAQDEATRRSVSAAEAFIGNFHTGGFPAIKQHQLSQAVKLNTTVKHRQQPNCCLPKESCLTWEYHSEASCSAIHQQEELLRIDLELAS